MRLPQLSSRTYERLTLAVLFALGFIIVTGAGVRLTGSGLGCSQWPTCENGQIVAPMEIKPWIEFGNRLITGLVSAGVIAAVLGSLLVVPRRRDLTRLSIGLVVGVLAQIVLGGYAVRYGLQPIFVTAHFLVSIALVWNGVVLHRRASQPPGRPVAVVGPTTRNFGRVIVALSLVVLVTGTIVTGAGPHAGDERAPRYGFEVEAVARLHSLTVWLFLIVTVALLWHLTRTGAPTLVDRRARVLVAAILAQGALGYAQYFAGVPAYLVAFHVLGSVLVFVAALSLHLSLFTRAGTDPGGVGSERVSFTDADRPSAGPTPTLTR